MMISTSPLSLRLSRDQGQTERNRRSCSLAAAGEADEGQQLSGADGEVDALQSQALGPGRVGVFHIPEGHLQTQKTS